MKLTTWLKEEAAFLSVVGIILLMSSIFLAVNLFDTHYHGLSYQFPTLLRYSPWALAIIFISAYLRQMSARFSLVFEVLWKIYFVYMISAFACIAIQYTPFHLVDSQLNHIDHLMGFYSGSVYSFSMQHHWVKAISLFVYKHLGYELFLFPLLLGFLVEKRSVKIFFLCNLIATLIAYLLYYFFPTTEPAHVVPGINFIQGQYDVVAQWYEVHRHLSNYMHIGALIGFPSFHVIWSVLLVYLCRQRKWLFYPVMIFNALVVLSTMTLGWHFLTDVIGGFIVGFASIYLAEKMLPKEKSVDAVNKGKLFSSRQFCQGFDRQALNDNGKHHDAVSHR